MRLLHHLQQNNVLESHLVLCESLEMNEMSNETLKKLKLLGKKMGFKVKPSKSLIDYMKQAEGGLEDLLRYATLYMMTDVKDKQSRKELVGDAKKVLKGIEKRDLAGFLMQLDKVSLGLSSHIRHIFQSVFGIEITTINNWLDDAKYLEKELRHIRRVLNRMDNTEGELRALDKFEGSLKDILQIVGR